MTSQVTGRIYARDVFFKRVRKSFGELTQDQVDGFNLILAEAEKRQTDIRQFAYILATVWHETARTMRPIEELGHGAGHAYGRSGFWGRGYVQLTWAANYRKATRELHEQGVLKPDEDLAMTPALAMRPDVALAILFVGMSEGWFTGKKLSDFITIGHVDWVNARRIINSLDKAHTIAGYAQAFLGALVVTNLPDAAAVAQKPHPSSATPVVAKALNPPADKGAKT